MHRLIVCVLISVVCLVSSGCPGTMMHGYIPSHSEITAPTFCLYEGLNNEHLPPVAIYQIQAFRAVKVNWNTLSSLIGLTRFTSSPSSK